MEIGNLPKKEFRVTILKMMKELGRRMDAHSKKLEVFFFFFFNEDLESDAYVLID